VRISTNGFSFPWSIDFPDSFPLLFLVHRSRMHSPTIQATVDKELVRPSKIVRRAHSVYTLFGERLAHKVSASMSIKRNLEDQLYRHRIKECIYSLREPRMCLLIDQLTHFHNVWYRFQKPKHIWWPVRDLVIRLNLDALSITNAQLDTTKQQLTSKCQT
jgi:hypothetical protein